MKESEVTEASRVEVRLVKAIISGLVGFFLGVAPLIWYAAQLKSTVEAVAAQITSVMQNDANQSRDISDMKSRLTVIEGFGSAFAREKFESIHTEMVKMNVSLSQHIASESKKP